MDTQKPTTVTLTVEEFDEIRDRNIQRFAAVTEHMQTLLKKASRSAYAQAFTDVARALENRKGA